MSSDVEVHNSHKDLMDLLTIASSEQKTLTRNGQEEPVQIIKNSDFYWMSRIVPYPKFAQLAAAVQTLENLIEECDIELEPEAAAIVKKYLNMEIKKCLRSINSKSSESLYDKHNRQSPLVDRVNNFKTERSITMDDNAKNAMGAAFSMQAAQQAQQRQI